MKEEIIDNDENKEEGVISESDLLDIYEFEYNDLFSGYDGVKNLIEAKAIEENINLDSKEAVAAIQYCSECVPVLLELLSVNNVMDIKKFTDNI